jgi:hypothetical protein
VPEDESDFPPIVRLLARSPWWLWAGASAGAAIGLVVGLVRILDGDRAAVGALVVLPFFILLFAFLAHVQYRGD